MILSPRSRDFNPRPRKEGDVTTGLYLLCFLLISIHALVKRATSFHCLYYNVPLYFNPRPRKEGDSRFIVYIITYLCISIHALVKRATVYDKINQFITSDFNPRPRKEGDRSTNNSSWYNSNFNPRPRKEGDDDLIDAAEAAFDISIHALVKRATWSDCVQ